MPNGETLVLLVFLNSVDDIVGGKLDTIAPFQTRAQFYRHFGEVLVVDRWFGGQRIVPDLIVDAIVRVDIPESVHAQLLQPGGPATSVCRPDVEPTGVS